MHEIVSPAKPCPVCGAAERFITKSKIFVNRENELDLGKQPSPHAMMYCMSCERFSVDV